MKHVFAHCAVVVMMLATPCIYAQTASLPPIYIGAEMVDINNDTTVKAVTIMFYGLTSFSRLKCIVDYGQRQINWSNEVLVMDENKKAVKFESPMGGVNLFLNRGWVLLDAWAISGSGGSNVYHFAMVKEKNPSSQP